ncbi:SH3 domain-containing protein [Mucilaginibacter pedocola]|uniref:N-acetylmuramoyl-L-alanine amidase n=1 Tax=Mucilaginibacter pedocola TaxID=1792845 RepID=A0A1S9PL76_9SPHI|nr:SH3 domain-containing protein [Mucilaginibacter pedocola]OOQ61713.1 N-acetylmuramoyl-L-alanine amidase [Mucilaginibacter pedocola]
MKQKFGFTLMDFNEFDTWLKALQVSRTVLFVQEHHTYSPAYAQFNGNNHFDLQQGMKNYHVAHNGWSDIAQQFTTFPDGTIMTGRPMEVSPACIFGRNANSVCIENLGNFDIGGDAMTSAQRDTIVKMTALLCKRFNIKVDDKGIVYHHWFDLATGERNNGTKNNKTCPGTNFFGGNKVANAQANFFPLVAAALNGTTPPIPTPPSATLLKYVSVTASTLNVRVAPNPSSAKAGAPVVLGAVLRVYQESNGWYKISASQNQWVAAQYTKVVQRATVTADTLNARSGPGTTFAKVGAYPKGQELFIEKEENKWCKILMDSKWVSKDYLSFA